MFRNIYMKSYNNVPMHDLFDEAIYAGEQLPM